MKAQMRTRHVFPTKMLHRINIDEFEDTDKLKHSLRGRKSVMTRMENDEKLGRTRAGRKRRALKEDLSY